MQKGMERTDAREHIIGNPELLGAALRRLRQSQGTTVKRLAEQVGLSKGYISLVESGKRTPHWATLMKLLHALGDTLCNFLTREQNVPPPEENVRSRREDLLLVAGTPPDERGRAPGETGDGYTWILTSHFEGVRSEIIELCLPPHTPWTPFAITFPAHVTAIGVEGQVLLELGEMERNEFVMARGETLQYDARLPHRLRNFTDDTAKSLLVISPAVF